MHLRAALVALVAIAACGAQPLAGDARQLIDGGCPGATPRDPVAVGTIAGVPSTELSGLAASHTVADVLWTHGDSGGAAAIYALDATTAGTLGTLQLAGATNVDWEDIATAPCAAGRCIYVADTGDNDLSRKRVAIYELIEPSARPAGVVDVGAVKYELTYPDGAHNVEALFVDPRDGRSYGITKVKSAAAVVYELPRSAGATSEAVLVATLAVPSADPRVTAADIVVDACQVRLAIRSHDALYELSAAADTPIAELLQGPLQPIPVAVEPQGEAVAWSADGLAYYTVSEGAGPTLWRVDVR